MGSDPPDQPVFTPTPDRPEDAERDLIRFQRRLNLLAATLIVMVALVYLLNTFSTVLQHLFVALFLVYLLMPPYRWLVAWGISPLFACIVMVAGILIGFAVLGVLIGNSFADLEAKLPVYRETLARLIDEASEQVPGLGSEAAKRLREPQSLEQGTKLLQAVLRAVSDFLSQSFVVLIYLFFMLAERAGLRQRMASAFAPEQASYIEDLLQRISGSITQYIVVKTLMSLLGGVLTWAILFGFGVDYAPVWGLIAFLFNYIPYLGSILATALPILLSLVQFEDPWRTLIILVLLLAMQNLIGYLIEPRLAGRRLDLRPLVIITSLAFWGSLWGIIGMILAVPLAVVIKMILEQSPATRPLAKMLSNA